MTADHIVTFRGFRETPRGHRYHPMAKALVELRRHDGRVETLPHRGGHSPTGLEWGYSGSGPTDLAISLIVALTGRQPEPAVMLHVRDRIVAQIQSPTWEIPAKRIRDAIFAAEHGLAS